MSRSRAPSLLPRLLVLLLLWPLVGCMLERPPEQRPVNNYLADARDLANVRRIMVLPFAEDPGVVADTDRIRDSYLAELQKLRRFEIVPLPASALEVDELNRSVRHGSLSTEAVVRLCNRYHLDGVLVGTVTAWRAYTPPHLGMRTNLVSVHSGAVVWAVDALYDSNDRSTVNDLRHFHDHVQAHDGNLHGWEFDLIAPSRFCSYVAHRLVGTWVEG
ncbi:MAG: hypothetical protein AB7O97_13815 [Planctomycetota bacterium]